MKRSTHFKKEMKKPRTVRDSRFGIRILARSNESPRIGEYMDPGRGPNGEHQS